MERTFTLDEANALLPQLEVLLRSGIACKQRLEKLQEELRALFQGVAASGGSLLRMSETAARKQDFEQATESLRDALLQINATGAKVKDLDIGLLDFPCVVGDEVVLLCWKLGESSITFWHSVEDGFKGRKPVDERIPRSSHRPS